MKKIVLASAVALATVSAAIAPSQAAMVVVRTNGHRHDQMRMEKHCKTTWVTHWKHHKRVSEKVTVCK